MRLAQASVVVAALLAGCGGAKMIPPPTTANDPGYPSPPYGYAQGQVLPDLLLAGKEIPPGTVAESSDLQMISLGALRGNGTRYFVIETAGAWCDDCAGDQPAMMQLEADYSSKGVLGVEILLEGAFDAAPTPDDLDNWSGAHSVSGTLLFDANRAVELAADIIAFPSYFIVDAVTMQIVTRSTDTMITNPLGPTLDSLLAQ